MVKQDRAGSVRHDEGHQIKTLKDLAMDVLVQA
jgi:hypothetical protein